jgi:hypothetical protein
MGRSGWGGGNDPNVRMSFSFSFLYFFDETVAGVLSVH